MTDQSVPSSSPAPKSDLRPALTWREAGRLNRRPIIIGGLLTGLIVTGMYATTGLPKTLLATGMVFVLAAAAVMLLAWAIFYGSSFDPSEQEKP